MNIYEDINIEDLITQDIQRIDNVCNKVQREMALRKYYNDPNYCKYCGNIILILDNQKPSDVRKKQFCNSICAAKHNNSIRVNVKTGPTSILDSYSDNDFINAYNKCTSYRQLSIELGYKMANSKITNMLRDRIHLLGLNDYDENKITIASSTKGELISRSSNWQSWRSQVQKHARDIYRHSSKPKKCIICEYDKTYEVAHINSVSDYDNDILISEINDVNNLVALCPNHHWEYDHGYLKLNDYII